MGGGAVAAYAQDLGTFLLEPVVVYPEGGDLVASTTSKVKDVEGEDYVLLTLVLAQGNLLSALGRKGKVGGRITYFCCHLYASSGLVIGSVGVNEDGD